MVKGRNTRAVGLRLFDWAWEYYEKEALKKDIPTSSYIRILLENNAKIKAEHGRRSTKGGKDEKD